MDLSNDLISKFVKITNDDKNKNSESTVYGTVVEYNGGMYVRIDGSDLLTPVETTADFKPDERVTVMIKNHSATVTGNITSPATNEGAVTEKVTEAVEDVEGKVITEVEILIADRVSTEQLDAEVARIDELIAGKATIEDLEAIDAKIENLEVENLEVINAEIKNLKANKAEIDDLKATTAEIDILDAKVASIDTLVNGNLTSDNILSFNITSQNTTMENAFIKDAMIDSITANKIMSGVIDTNNVRVQSTDGSLLIQGTLIQMKDEDGKVRIQIGKDTGGNFTFILYDKSGTGVLIDEDGIKSSNAIADGLIVDAKVADNANISGSKLDIASVITEVNNDNSTTIKSNKIYLDEQKQSLEVAFNSLKSQVETIQDVTIDGDLTAVVEQVQSNTTKIEANKEGISTLVAENTIRKEEIQNLNGEIEGVNNTLSSKYSSLEQDVSGFKTTVADTYTTKSEFNNLEVGGRNLLENSSFKNDINKWIANGSSFYSFVINEGRQCCKIDMTKLNYGYTIRQSILTDLVYGETYTVSGWVKTENIRQGTTNYELMFYIDGWYDNNGVDTWYGLCRKGFPINTGTGSWQHISGTFTVDNPAFRTARLCDFYVYARDFTGQVYFYDVKLEKGNKATDWSPAPEDIQGQIDATNANLQNNYSTTSAMNSAIQQKANEITSSVSQTYATKQSVTDVSNNLANNYSTTTQMNSAINQKANQITSSVSQTYTTKSEFNNLEVGGRNLLENSSFKKDVSKWTPNVSNFYSFVTNDGKQCCKIDMTKLNHSQIFDQSILTDLVYGETYTVSGWVKTENIRQGTTNYRIMFYIDGYYNKNGTDTWYGLGSESFPINTGTGSWQHISWTFTVNNEGFRLARSCKFSVYTRDFTGQVYFYDIKLEKGNKATDWTPSPEDVQEQIDATNTNLQNNYSTTSQMNSAINQKANAITSSVSQTYATKQSVTDVSNNLANNYSTTTQMNSAINQKANAITSSVSQTYATKQSVTDVSNNLTNNLTNNYSTTSQMNSIIQQTASDLTLKFSESGGYNLLQNGHANKGTSYWQDNGGGIKVSGGASGNATGNYFNTSLPQGIRYYDWVKLLPNTHYVYQAKVWTDITFNGNGVIPLHFLFSYDGSNRTHDGYTILDYQQNVPNTEKWTQCYVHFVTGTVSIYFRPFIFNNLASTSKFYVTELMLSQSRVVLPWSPHPSEIYSGITQIDKDGIKVHHNNANSYTHMSPDGFFVNSNGTDVVQVTSNGLYVQGNITSGSTIQGARITGSTFNSSNDVFQVLEDGTIETSFLAVNGAVSTDKLNVNDIENASYPKVLSEATTVYIHPNGGVNAEEFYDGAYFTSISNMLAVAPRNLNGYTLSIRLMADVYENAAFTWFHSGQINFELQKHTLYGYFYGYGASMVYRLYGDTSSSSAGTWGHIKPNAGRNLGSYYYAVLFQYCQFAVNSIAVYPSASSGSSSGGIGAHRGATGNVFSAKACGDLRYLVRAEYGARVHVNSTEGVANNATFCATTGGIITLNSSNNQAGRSTTGNPYWVGSGGLILCDQILGMDKITFNNTAQSGSSSSSGSTTRKVTETIKATSADTYRSTVYNNWKGDGTVRQGDYGYGDCQGCWFFGNNLYTTMNAGTVTKVVIRIQRQSGGVNAKQTLTVKSHNHTSRPSGAPTYTGTIGTCSCAVGSYIDLVITDSTTINKLKACKGLGLSIGSTSSPYAVCSGACSVIITYTTSS